MEARRPFGSTGGSTFLGKLTTAAAIVFMMSCLGLTYFSSRPEGKSVMEKVKVEVEEKQGPALPDAKPAQAAPSPATKAPSAADSSAAPQAVPDQGGPATGSGQSASQPAIGAILSHWVTGLLRDSIGLYYLAFLTNGVMALAGLVLILFVHKKPS